MRHLRYALHRSWWIQCVLLCLLLLLGACPSKTPVAASTPTADLDMGIVDAICDEVRSALSYRGQISDYDRVVEGRPEVHAVSLSYKRHLDDSVDWFRRLSLGSITHGAALTKELTQRLSMDSSRNTVGPSRSQQLFADWKRDFKQACEGLI